MSETWVCGVCGDAADDSNSADCSFCHERFHLRLRNDSDDRDCGEVWISPEHQALEFGCLSCVGREGSPGGPVEPPVEPPLGAGH